MLSGIKSVILLVVIYIVIDVVYLGVIQRSFVTKFFKTINNGEEYINVLPGLVAWTLLGWGMYYFVLSRPGWTMKDVMLLALLVYGVYDFTNVATISKWTWTFVFADILWGIVAMVLVATIYFKLSLEYL